MGEHHIAELTALRHMSSLNGPALMKDPDIGRLKAAAALAHEDFLGSVARCEIPNAMRSLPIYLKRHYALEKRLSEIANDRLLGGMGDRPAHAIIQEASDAIASLDMLMQDTIELSLDHICGCKAGTVRPDAP